MRRLSLAGMAFVFAVAGFVPSASAAGFTITSGSGNAVALQLSVPVLGIVPVVSSVVKGVTVARASNSFDSTSVKGEAVAICEILKGTLPCSQTSAASSSAGNPGSPTANCLQNLNLLALLNIQAACATSSSSESGGLPTSANSSTVADINAGVPPAVTAVLGTITSATTPVVQGVSQVITNTINSLNPTIQGLPAVGGTAAGLLTTVTTAVTNTLSKVSSLATVSTLVDIQAGTSSSNVAPDSGGGVTVSSEATGAKVALLKVPVVAPDGLITVEVGHAIATASYGSNNQATGSVEPALAIVRVFNLTGTSLPVPLPVENGYFVLKLSVPDVNSLLAPLAGVLFGGVQLNPASHSVTVSPDGRSVSATTSGVEVNALTALGESSPGANDGGVRLRIAGADAAISGAPITPTPVPAKSTLPVTGGPIYLYFAGGLALAVLSITGFGVARKLRSTT